MGVYGFTNNMCLYTYMDYKPRILSGMHIFISKISAASNLKQFHFEVTKYVGRLKQQIMFTEGWFKAVWATFLDRYRMV